MTTRNPNRCPTHPGEILAESLEHLDISKTEIARILQISRQHLHGILKGERSVTAITAARIGKLLGNGPTLWLQLQANYNAWHVERDIDVSSIPTLEASKKVNMQTEHSC
ncbi:HigA family addiction module antitoxin [Candidatus Bartonella washoeensis]|uniref:HigA family addiction module antidote protein n=1 Tax=Cardidatus Bartonella washoeensis 085-0475 TaxID=1094564 RepID=J1JLX9_9HYPH|nr:HigA family addiction module antitoxin [Bartonella washoeensis]EJF85275.1 HigA family addiction module antidote protein [Bartonella washoeensis 085-0475]